MVKPAFENLEIEAWFDGGKLGKSQPTLCLFHGTLSTGTQLCDALLELKQQARPARRTLTLRDCSRKSALRELKLTLVPAREDLQMMHVGRSANAAIIELTEDGLSLLMDALAAWLAGREDFGVSPRSSSLKRNELGKLDLESAEIWFWGPYYAGP